MPARHPVRPVRSGPSGLSGPGALGHWSGPDGPDRTGQGRHRALAKSSLALSSPVRPVRSSALGPGRPDRTDRTGPDLGRTDSSQRSHHNDRICRDHYS